MFSSRFSHAKKGSSLKKYMVRILKCLLAVVILLAVIIFGLCAYAMHSSARAVPVLNYHQINDWAENPLTVHTDQFKEQMAYLKENGYHTITPDELLDAFQNGTELPEKPVVLTFDDGYQDNYENVYPLLQEYGFKGSIFVVSDFVSMYPNYLTWDEIAEMQKSGIIDFESHTMTHPELNRLNEEDRWHELKGSKDNLEKGIGKDINYIAYPCGSYDSALEQMTKDAGYRAAFTVNYGLASPSENPFVLDRIPIFGCNRHTLLRFKLRLCYSPIFAPLAKMSKQLKETGHEKLASLILIP